MSNDLINWIERRIDDDPTLDDEVGLLVLAALEGESELDECLRTGTWTRSPELVASREATDPASGAFLRSVRVTGFRGIGARVTLPLEPTPGLTVVAGRNGSGKSSLAEGLELTLTGGTYRWKNKKSTQWSERWRNLHHEDQAEVAVEIVEEGAGPIRMVTTWRSDATDVADHETTAQRTVGGTKGPVGPATALGWTSALETYRPLLSYDELGGLLEAGPSELYDAIAKVLGTGQLADALRRIKTRHGELSGPLKAANTVRRELQAAANAMADGTHDERARTVAALLKKTAPDTTAVLEVATGVALPDGGVVTSLRALAGLQPPDPAAVSRAAGRLRSAVAAMADAGEAEAARRVARLEVRRQALRLHAEHGDQSCPVCSSGTLDAGWAESSSALVAREDGELEALSTARHELEAARRDLRATMQRRPAPTDRAPVDELDDVAAAARDAWDAYQDVPGADLDLADHLELHAAELASVVGTLRAAATAALAERDDAWGPLAGHVAAWCETWDAAVGSKPSIDRLASAEKWLKDNDTALKNERIAPISEKAKHAWSLLRQESDVDLGDLRLEGQANRRRVALTAAIGGVDAGNALPLLSQGELHALALALFLPRASLDASPFRFVVLDDPVQAMDPAKVDGLVTLLSEIARTRQVVVFSHDDRLPAALRRNNVNARIHEVVRGTDSAVTITAAEDPTLRYLGDADALCRDAKVPAETLRRTLPGLLRMAIEAAARDGFFSARIARGQSLHDVEALWNGAHGTSQRVSLAVYDEVRSLDDWLRTESRRKGLGVATSGFHQGMHSGTDPLDAVHHVRRTVEDVKTGAK